MRHTKRRFPSQRVNTLTHSSNIPSLQYDKEIEYIQKQYFSISHLELTDPSKVKNSIINDERLLHLVKYLLIKQKKTNKEIEILKLYLTHLDTFMNILSDINTNKDNLLTRLCFHMTIEQAETQGMIYKQGDKCDKMYLILNGKVCVLQTTNVTAKLNAINYMKYLMLLRFYEEKDLVVQVTKMNSNVYNVSDNAVNNLYMIFKFYKLCKENDMFKRNNNNNNNNNTNSTSRNDYSSLIEFLSKEKELYSLLNTKVFLPQNISLRDSLSPLNLSPHDVMNIYFYYESIYDQHKCSKASFIPFRSRTQTLRLSSFGNPLSNKTPSETILDSIYNDLLSENDPSLYYVSTKEYCNRLNHKQFISNDGNDITVCEYNEVTQLGKCDVFGENALTKTDKKIQHTIITCEPCCFSTITQHEFNICLRNTQEKIRSMNSKFFLKGAIFKNVNQNLFEMRFYNLFIEQQYTKGDVLIEKHSKKREVHFILEGEVDISIETSLSHLYNIINTLCVDNPMEMKVKQMLNAYQEFKHYFEQKKFMFAIAKFKQSEIIGLENFTLGNGVYLFDASCSSKHVNTFCLNERGYNYITRDAIVKANIDEYVYLKRQILCEHLCVIIESYITNYENKYNNNNDMYKKSKRVNIVSFNTSTQKKIKLKGNIDKGYEIPPIEKSCDFPTLKNVNSSRPYYRKFKSSNPIQITSFLSEQNMNYYTKYNNTINNNMNMNINEITNNNTTSNFNANIFSHSSSNECLDIINNPYHYQTIETNVPTVNASNSCFKTYYSNVPSYRYNSTLNNRFGLTSCGKVVQTHTGLTQSDLSVNKPVDVNSFRRTLRTKKVFIVKTRNGNKSLKEKKIKFYDNKTTYSNDIYMRTNHTVFNNILLPYENKKKNEIPDVIKHAQKKNNGFIDCLCLDKLIERHCEYPFNDHFNKLNI